MRSTSDQYLKPSGYSPSKSPSPRPSQTRSTHGQLSIRHPPIYITDSQNKYNHPTLIPLPISTNNSSSYTRNIPRPSVTTTTTYRVERKSNIGTSTELD